MVQRIKIGIADRIYAINVDPAKEENFRRAVKKISDAFNFYKGKYPNRDDQDALSMAILQFATILVDIEQKDEVGGLTNELKLLDKQLEEYIQSTDRQAIALCENQHLKQYRVNRLTKTGLGDPSGDSIFGTLEVCVINRSPNLIY